MTLAHALHPPTSSHLPHATSPSTCASPPASRSGFDATRLHSYSSLWADPHPESSPSRIQIAGDGEPRSGSPEAEHDGVRGGAGPARAGGGETRRGHAGVGRDALGPVHGGAVDSDEACIEGEAHGALQMQRMGAAEDAGQSWGGAASDCGANCRADVAVENNKDYNRIHGRGARRRVAERHGGADAIDSSGPIAERGRDRRCAGASPSPKIIQNSAGDGFRRHDASAAKQRGRAGMPTGRFWALADLEDSDDSFSDEEGSDEGVDNHIHSPNFGDALVMATDLRGLKTKRTAKRDKMAEIEERLRRNREKFRNRTVVARGVDMVEVQTDSHSHLDVRHDLDEPVTKSVDTSIAEILECSEEGWFKIVRGKAVRQNLNPFKEAARVVGGCSPETVLLRPPAGSSILQAQQRPWRMPGDDVQCFTGIKVSIKTLDWTSRSKGNNKGANGPSSVRRPNEKQGAGQRDLGIDAIQQPSQLELLLEHWWERKAAIRVPGEKEPEQEIAAAEAVMGDRFGNRGGGGGGGYGVGAGGGGYSDYRDGPPHRAGGGGYLGYRDGPPHRPPYNGPQRPQNQGDFYPNSQGNQFYGNRGRYNSNFNQKNNVQYARKDGQKSDGPNSSGANSSQQQTAASDKQVASGVQANSSEANQLPPKGGPVSSGHQSAGAHSEAVKQNEAAKAVCNKCGLKGHWTKDCSEDVACVNCGKGHMSDRCAWLKQKKSVASLVGFGAPGLACFVANHAKDGAGEDKGKSIAIVRVKQGANVAVSAELLEKCLGKTYPWKWDWQARELTSEVFLVKFPSVSRINEVSIYYWVALKGEKIKINVKQWSDETMAAGKMDTVWVQAKRVPKTLKNFHGLCEVGSTVGQVLEVDMKTLSETGEVRLMVGVVDYRKIPQMTKLTTEKLMIYYIYFQLEKVVEEGWLRPEEEYIQNFDEMEDSISQELESREAKRHKNGGEEKIAPAVAASEQTIRALQEKEAIQKRQDEMDALKLAEIRNKAKGVSKETAAADVKQNQLTVEKQKETTKEGGGDTEKQEFLSSDQADTGVNEKVDYSGTEHGGAATSDSSVSFGTKMKIIQEGKAVKGGVLTSLDEVEESLPRFSNRLAPKSDIPIMDRAKNLTKTKNLQTDGGETGK